MYAFELERPTTLADALKALGGEEAQPLSGGQTLIPTLKQRLAMPSTLVSLTGIDELKGIKNEGGTLTISQFLSRRDAVRASYFPVIRSETALVFASFSKFRISR